MMSRGSPETWKLNGNRRRKLSRAATVHCTKKNKYAVEKAIRGAKTVYRHKLEGQFLSNDTRSVWQGLQCITGYKQKHSIPGFDSAAPDNFYAHFDHQNLRPISVSLPDPAVPLPSLFKGTRWESYSSNRAAGKQLVLTMFAHPH